MGHYYNNYYNTNYYWTHNSQKKFKIQKFQEEIFRTVPSSKKNEVGHSRYLQSNEKLD